MPSAMRRQRPALDIWPGFVDALTTLVMVVIFVLVVFIFAQQFLSTQLNDNVSQIKSLLNENEQLDVQGARKALEELIAKHKDTLPANCQTAEGLAHGFLLVANEAMCRPIRNLTQMKGFDIR